MAGRDDNGKDAGSGGNPKNFVNSVAKVFSVLKAFDSSLPELTVTEVAGRASLDRGTAFRLVHTLCHLGYLASVPNSRRYRLTLKCLELGFTSLTCASLKTLARPLLHEVVPQAADAASLGILDGPDVVYVERSEIEQPHSNVDRRPGARTPAYGAALGHAMLACLPPDHQRAILSRSRLVRLSERTLVDIDAILARLVEVRHQGFAVSDGENAFGLRTVAAAVLDASGAPAAGVSLTIHAERAGIDTFVANAVPIVRRIANDLTRAMRLSFDSITVSR